MFMATSLQSAQPHVVSTLLPLLVAGVALAATYLAIEPILRKRKQNIAKCTGEADSSTGATPGGKENQCMVVVDCYSSGAQVAYYAQQRGYKIICLWSTQDEALLDLVPKDLDITFDKILFCTGKTERDKNAIHAQLLALPWEVVGVIAGGETGVDLCDSLSERMGLRTNGAAGTIARRDKWHMGEKIRAAGVRAVEQQLCSNMSEVESFLQRHTHFPVVVKPIDSAGSDGVTLCDTREKVHGAFKALHMQTNVLGSLNEAVLVQEFLCGTEYVVDTVSRDGVHKVAAIWEYDRRAGPDGTCGFVCYGQKLISADTEIAKKLVEYQFSVNDALGIRNGAAHSEVKICRGEAVLVEVGARCQGAEGFWCKVADECLGYNQAEALIDCYTPDSTNFDNLPAVPKPKKAGRIKILISYHAGEIKKIKCVDKVKSLPSYREFCMFVEEGKAITLTTNCFTWLGFVTLCHEDEGQIADDYKALERIEQVDLLQVA
jgi:biotin carboxylase